MRRHATTDGFGSASAKPSLLLLPPLWGKAGMGGCHDSSTAVDTFTLSLSHEGRGNPCPTDRLKRLRTIQPHSIPAADFTTGAATLFGKADSPPTTCCTSSNVSPFVS